MPLFSHYGELPDISSRLSYPSLVFSIITPLVVLARLWSRHFLSGLLGADDWVILLSMVFAETVSIQMIIICSWAFGKHVADMPNHLLLETLKVYFVAQILYKVGLGLTKISILLFYIRIFVQRWFLIICWTWIGLVVAFTTGSVMSSIFQCTPIQFAFNKALGGTCINMTAFWYANAAFNILSDVVLIILPIPVISKLQLPLKSKMALCGVFAVGLFTCITSILRITTLNLATSHLDTTWNSIGSSMWTVIEENLGIICACLPALQRPMAKMIPGVFTGRYKSSGRYQSSYPAHDSDFRPPNSKSKPPRSNSNQVSGWSIINETTPGTIVQDDERSEASQELIANDGRHSKRGIHKTTEVVLEYDSYDDDRGMELNRLGRRP